MLGGGGGGEESVCVCVCVWRGGQTEVTEAINSSMRNVAGRGR